MATARSAIRHSIGHRLRQPFFTRLGSAAESAAADSGSTTTLVDANLLLQEDDFWNGHFVYRTDSDEVRFISDFDQGTNTVTILEPLANAFGSSDSYEIWSTISPHEVNEAINVALRNAWPWFFRRESEEVVVQADSGDGYTLSDVLTYTPYKVLAVEMEDLVSSVTGQVTSGGTSTQLIDSNAAFTSADVGKSVRIYEGTGVGDIRTVSTVDSTTQITVSSAFSSTLDTTSKYRLVDADANERGFRTQISWYLDKKENPTTLRFTGHPYSLEGYVFLVRYEAQFSALSTDAATTNCPLEFVELRALVTVTNEFYSVLGPRSWRSGRPHMRVL